MDSRHDPYCQHLDNMGPGCRPEKQSCSGQDVIYSADRGCAFCTVILAAKKRSFHLPNVRLSAESETWQQSFTFTDSGLDVKITEGTFRRHGFTMFTAGGQVEGLVPRCEHFPQTGSELSFRIAADWFMTCLNNHRTLCHSMSENCLKLPYRVLDIGSDHDQAVVLREHIESEACYACLSHCWGGSEPLKTMKATLETHKRGIRWGDIPATFQDAIAFVRSLTIRYIWIDSLCIVQDDEDDWNMQTSLMAEIYRNAKITISATAAAVPAARPFSTYPVYSHTALSYSPHTHPLLTRGWVFQERLLSPRFLHFTTHELVWECMQTYHCQCTITPNPRIVRDPYITIARSWRAAVQDYSRLQLTQSADVFPAVAGVARLFAQAMARRGVRTEYVAGLWSSQFVEDCLWSVHWPVRVRARE
ncbi:HET-domain-containing protein [Polyplosphaeria fusca]|uniref:HET-domain-containing protein n=1 Tax=Polyplosphaeria fusca TaxID=682080 RepID=A0A9P4QN89_9PLEO|nr:HET-domain-containing protein [Polyplosphaeria fusca]